MATVARNLRPEQTASIARQISRENTPSSPVVQELRRQVANAFVLYANHKHYHWQTFGPHFRDLHKLFDDFAAEVLSTLDELAERVRMIGQDPPAHPLEAEKLSTVSASRANGTMREMIEEANRNALIVIKEMRHGAKVADEHDDPGTVDMFSKFVQIHEKEQWWLRDILRDGDGLDS
jgi:starvation-inducible DNA-binding protein